MPDTDELNVISIVDWSGMSRNEDPTMPNICDTPSCQSISTTASPAFFIGDMDANFYYVEMFVRLMNGMRKEV